MTSSLDFELDALTLWCQDGPYLLSGLGNIATEILYVMSENKMLPISGLTSLKLWNKKQKTAVRTYFALMIRIGGEPNHGISHRNHSENKTGQKK